MSAAHGAPPGAQDVHVVVLNWRGREDTLACVDSVLADAIEPTHVLVVDNGSDDGIEEALAAAHPAVRFVQTGANRGFTGGMNRGLNDCLDRGAAFVCVLNNDTHVVPGMFAELVRHAPPGTAVSPEVRYLADPDAIWFGGGTVDADGCWPRHLTEEELDALDARSGPVAVRETESLAGCCILASAATWRTVGLFDPAYFLLFEDADWSARARVAGVRLAVVRGALLLHAVSASFTGPGHLLGSYYYARNGMRFGRTRVTRRPVPRARFVRDQLVRPVLRRARRGELRASVVEGGFVAAGIVADALRVYGPAPRVVTRAARSLSTTRSAGAARPSSEPVGVALAADPDPPPGRTHPTLSTFPPTMRGQMTTPALHDDGHRR